MGIKCEINLSQPTGSNYLPGQIVSGVIKYKLDKPTEIERITTTLNGRGVLKLEISGFKYTDVYKSEELYVDVQNIIQSDKTKLPKGNYEVPFNFNLPHNIPSTTFIKQNTADSYIFGRIKYFIGIHFELSGLFSFNKKFTKQIVVFSKGIATLPKEPVNYEEERNLMQLFSKKSCTVTLKATINISVIPIGGKINVQYEIKNNSTVRVKCILTKLIEIHDFRVKRLYKQFEKVVPGAIWQTGAIDCEETQVIPLELDVPSDRYTLDYSKIITRHYIIRVIALMPIPHRNIVIDIPIEVGSDGEDPSRSRTQQQNVSVNPPTYWEAMGEEAYSVNESNSNVEIVETSEKQDI